MYVFESNRLLRTMTCSTGIPGTEDATPPGDFVIDESGAKRGEGKDPTVARVGNGIAREALSGWLSSNFRSYKQKYPLSCEIALTRLGLAIFGLEASEDEILSTIPRSGRDPERAFVCDDINGGRRLNGKILWDNYGTHPPVVVAEIERRLGSAGLAGRYEARELRDDDEGLRLLIRDDPRFLGAIVWLVGHPERWGEKPPVNERGMVLGEHVRFLEPALTAVGSFRIWDPENGRLIVSPNSGAARELFGYRIVGLFSL
jgi:hypothetical protein